MSDDLAAEVCLAAVDVDAIILVTMGVTTDVAACTNIDALDVSAIV
jgi:hypothetical protein